MKTSSKQQRSTQQLSLEQRQQRWRDRHEHMCTVMSARQYTMALYIEQLGSRTIDLETLEVLHQGTIRSMLIRGWLKQASGTTVRWTKEGAEATRQFANEKYDRKPSHHFCSLLSLDAYDSRREHSESRLHAVALQA